MSDKETKTVDRLYEPDKACPGLDPGDPEAKSGTDQFPRVEREDKALKISMWIGVPTVLFILIFWICYNYLGLWFIRGSGVTLIGRPCSWLLMNLPLQMVGNGVLHEGISWRVQHYFFYERRREAIPYLAKKVMSSNETVAQNAAQTLHNIAHVVNAKEAVPALIMASKHNKHPVAREMALTALAAIDPKARNVINAFIEALKDENSRVKIEAAEILARIGPAAADALPDLFPLLQHEKVYVQIPAACAIIKINPEKKEALTFIIERLKKEENSNCYCRIAEYLGRLGPQAKDAVPILIEVLSDIEYYTRSVAALALGEIGDISALPFLKKGLKEAINKQEKDSFQKAIDKLEEVKAKQMQSKNQP